MKQKKILRAFNNTIVYSFMLMLISCYNPETFNDSKVTLTIFTHGTHKLWTFSLSTDSILIIKHSINNKPDTTVVSRKLTLSEKENVYALFKSTPLASLKNSYINKQVEGEIHREFDIRIGSERKKITVYFMEVEPLEKIYKVISSFAELNY